MRGSQLEEIARLFNGGTRWTVETGVVVELLEDKEGHFATVRMGAEEEPITVARMALYVGDLFGLFLPLKEGQEVPVFIPAADTCRTPFTFGAFGANIHEVPEDVLENPDDVWLIVEKDRHVRVRCSGDGVVSLVGKTVDLGGEDPDDHVVMWSELKKILANIKSTYDGHGQIIPIGGITVGAAPGPVLTNAAPVKVPAPTAKIDTAGNIAADKPKSEVVRGILKHPPA